MASILANVVLSHFAALQTVAGEVVTIVQDGEQTEVTAVPGAHLAQNDGVDIEEVVFEEYDWLISVAGYDFGNGPVKPKRGDLIKTDGMVYELMPRLEAQPYRYTDGSRGVYRLFTVEKGDNLDG